MQSHRLLSLTFDMKPRICQHVAARLSKRYIFSAARVHTNTTRSFATHQDPGPIPSSLLSQALDQKQRAGSSQKEDSVGPFQLGIGQQRYEQPNVKKWSELSTGGKGTRFVVHLYVGKPI